jgi:hypothetical protein
VKLQQKYDCIVDSARHGNDDRRRVRHAGGCAIELRWRVSSVVDNSRAGANTIRWSPPLILTKENVDVALEIFDEAIAARFHTGLTRFAISSCGRVAIFIDVVTRPSR